MKKILALILYDKRDLIIDQRKIRLINYLKKIIPIDEKLYLIDLTGFYLGKLDKDEYLYEDEQIIYFKPKNIGIIARTICSEQDEINIKNDFDRLFKIWHEVQHKIESSKNIQLIYQDFTISDLVIRDLFTESIKKLVIDSKPLYKRIYKFVEKNG